MTATSTALTAMTIALVLGATAAACSRDDGDAASSSAGKTSGQPSDSERARVDTEMMTSFRDACPMLINDVSIDVADTDTGAALSFTTTTGDVRDLRSRVRHMAQMYAMHHPGSGMRWHHMRGEHMGRGPGPSGGPGRMDGRGMDPMHGAGSMPAVDAEVEDVDGGARIVLIPKDPGDLAAVREHVRLHHERMRTGQCWMSQQHGAPPASDPSSP